MTRGKTQKMVYANDKASRTFPFGRYDRGTATLTHQFWMGETEVTNELFAAVYQWAYEHQKFSRTPGSPNRVSTKFAGHSTRSLVSLGEAKCNINYDSVNGFSVTSGKEKFPVTYVSWYGAIMFSNWLTEMRDGTTDNVVYSGINANWVHTSTIEDKSKNGYSLPSGMEWEYAARYTKGDSASGATANDAAAAGKVAVYNNQSASESSVKTKVANALGLYDMSGNVSEWCFTSLSATAREGRGGAWSSSPPEIVVSNGTSVALGFTDTTLGFRLCRTAD